MDARLCSKNRLRQQGNCALEMLLFTPLALLFLFVVVDGGLAYTERAAVRDALRSGIAGQTRTQHIAVYNSNPVDETGVELQQANVQSIAEDVLNDTYRQLQQTQDVSDSEALVRFRVEVLAAELSFDPTSGSYTGTSQTIYETARGELVLSQYVDTTETATPLERLNSHLQSQVALTPSPYAQPLLPTLNAEGVLSDAQFAAHTLVMLVQVSALPRGLNPDASYSLLGKFFALQDSEVFIVRRQLG